MPVKHGYRQTPEHAANAAVTRVGKYRGKPTANRFLAADGYIKLTGEKVKDHPLLNAAGQIGEHRFVLYEKIGPGPHPCHWCGKLLDWTKGQNWREGIQSDHLDDNKTNNDPSNLVPSCFLCNWHRADPWTARWGNR